MINIKTLLQKRMWPLHRVECGITLKLSMEIIYHKKNFDMLDPKKKKENYNHRNVFILSQLFHKRFRVT